MLCIRNKMKNNKKRIPGQNARNLIILALFYKRIGQKLLIFCTIFLIEIVVNTRGFTLKKKQQRYLLSSFIGRYKWLP